MNKNMEELEAIDKEYKTYLLEKQKLEKCRKAVTQYDRKIQIANNNITIYQMEKNNAILKGDKAAEKAAQNKIDGEKKNIEILKNSLLKIQSIIVNNQNKIDSQIQKVSNNPEVKKAVDAAISKKVVRKNQRLLQENAQLNMIKKLIETHSGVKKQIVGMKNAEVNIKKLNDDKSKLDPAKDAAQIAQIDKDIKDAQIKYDKNKKIIMDIANKDNLQLEEKYLDEFIEGNFKINKGTGEYNIEASLNNKIKGNQKSIDNNDKILSNINGRDIKTKLQDDNQTMEVEVNERSQNLPAVAKPKWWQFAKRFKNWRENRKNPKIPDVYNKTGYEKDITANVNNDFKNSLKYDIVKDYTKQREEELYKNIKKPAKEQDDGERK
ncbi:MAG: hypothetical protein J5881_02660 [Clostridia bacterium]|nr:hypothetical protein [Clostridia bacterium]